MSENNQEPISEPSHKPPIAMPTYYSTRLQWLCDECCWNMSEHIRQGSTAYVGIQPDINHQWQIKAIHKIIYEVDEVVFPEFQSKLSSHAQQFSKKRMPGPLPYRCGWDPGQVLHLLCTQGGRCEVPVPGLTRGQISTDSNHLMPRKQYPEGRGKARTDE